MNEYKIYKRMILANLHVLPVCLLFMSLLVAAIKIAIPSIRPYKHSTKEIIGMNFHYTSECYLFYY